MSRYAQVCRNSPKPKACTQPSHTTLPRVSRFYHSNIATIGDRDLEALVALVQNSLAVVYMFMSKHSFDWKTHG